MPERCDGMPGLHEQLEQIAVDWCKSQVHDAAVQTVNEIAAVLNTTVATPADAYNLVRMVAGIRQANRSLRHQVTAAHEELAAVLHDHGVEVTHLNQLGRLVDRAVDRIKIDAQTVRQLDADRTRATRQRDKAFIDADYIQAVQQTARDLATRLVERTTERDAWKQRTARLAETLEEILDGFGKVNSADSTGCMRGSVPQATVDRWRKTLADTTRPDHADANTGLLNRLADQLDQAAAGSIDAIPLPAVQVRTLLRIVDAVNTLTQPTGNVRVEWGVRTTWRDERGTTNDAAGPENAARITIRASRREIAELGNAADYTAVELICRTVTTGPWQTVPDTQETPDV